MQEYEIGPASNPMFDVFVHADGNVVIIADRFHASVLFDAWDTNIQNVLPAEGRLEEDDIDQETIDRVAIRMGTAAQAHSDRLSYASPLLD